MDIGSWQATIHGVARVRHDLEIKPPPSFPPNSGTWEGNLKVSGEHCLVMCFLVEDLRLITWE